MNAKAGTRHKAQQAIGRAADGILKRRRGLLLQVALAEIPNPTSDPYPIRAPNR